VERLREDIEFAAALATLALAVIALVGWVVTWPGSVVPTALSVCGLAAVVAVFVVGAIARASAAPRGLRVVAVAVRVVFALVVVAGVLAQPALARVVGGLTLAALLTISIVFLAHAARRRYGAPATSSPASTRSVEIDSE
jgi:hypothetical protein